MSEETLLPTDADTPKSAPSKKKAAKKATTKKAAKKTATKSSQPVEEPTPVVAPEAPVAAAAAQEKPVTSADATTATKPKRRPSKKKAASEPAATPETEAHAPVAEPAPAPAEVSAAIDPEATAETESESDDDASESERGPEPTRSGGGGDRAMPPAIAAMGYTVASNGEWLHPSGRRLRWWERRKLERKARQAARAAGAPGAPQQPAPQPQGQSEGRRHQHGRHQQQAAAEATDNDADIEMAKPVELGPPEPGEGLLEIGLKGHGFLRLKDKGWAALPTDCFVHGDIIRKYGLREGMLVTGEQRKGPRGPQLTEVFQINGRKPEDLRDLPIFEELKAVNPNKRYQLETSPTRYTTRVIDMLAPVGRGQRGLIVSPPRAGKTTILHHIAEAITQNYPQVHLIILLVDERPEEVTEFKRSLQNAELFASSNDQDAKSHGRIAQMAIERAKRLVEMGDHVFVLMDSITRLARAFNNMNKGGATMSGGMGVGSMEIPRRLFAAARNTRTAGSLTILATALVETGGKIDDLIFQEFKGTGNMELVLDRKIAEQFYWPAVNIFKSGTRREELLLQGFQLEKIHFLRRGLAGNKPIEAIQRVLQLLERYPNNAQMLVELASKEK